MQHEKLRVEDPCRGKYYPSKLGGHTASSSTSLQFKVHRDMNTGRNMSLRFRSALKDIITLRFAALNFGVFEDISFETLSYLLNFVLR